MYSVCTQERLLFKCKYLTAHWFINVALFEDDVGRRLGWEQSPEYEKGKDIYSPLKKVTVRDRDQKITRAKRFNFFLV